MLDEIDDSDLDSPSLWDGWRIRDVVSHMLIGHTAPLRSVAVVAAEHWFNVRKASFTSSIDGRP